SVPVNVFNRAQIADELFMAVFQADENSKPFWPGNLKKLAITKNAITGKTELQDVNQINAIDIDGRIKREALTFWTDPATLPAPTPTDDFVAGADGREVERGGAGQKIPGLMSGNPGVANGAPGTTRQLFTEGGAGALIPLNADDPTAADVWAELTSKWLPPVSPTYALATGPEQIRAKNLLGWARGFNGTDLSTKRNWFMADPLHSRPRPINYGARGSYTATNQDVRILMGTNDGIVHMFTNIKPDGSHDGSEAWGFLPREALPLLDRLSANGAGTPIHPISSDGAPSVLVDDTDLDGTIEAGEKVWAFFGMRRGGKSYYALDITDPDNPQFMWKITKGDPGFEELGQTWSVPQTGKLDYTNDSIYNPEDVIVFSGGYNGDDDGDNVPDPDELVPGSFGKDDANRNGTAGADDNEGNAIYVVEAKTGKLIWKASHWKTLGVPASDGFDGSNTFGVSAMKDSIPSDVTAVDLTGDGLLDRIYVGDLGGVVWRADIAGDDISQWKVGQLLSVGRHDAASGGVDRRFFNAPDVALSKDKDGPFDAVLIGTGDREDPLDKNMEDNFFYMVKDRNTTSGTPPVGSLYHDNLADLTIDCVTAGNCSSATDALLYNGWTLQLGASGSGEKNLAPALTLGGIVFFTTFEPKAAASVCGLNEGTGYLYAVNLQDATPAFNFDTTNDSAGVTNERRDELESGGIPVQPVPTSGDEIIIQGQASPNNIMDVDTATSWKTFWYDLFN
ncbi:MAG: pilus assembly protein, partial [Gammaproteobacteria bacterium]